jgi:hypothetical protein
MIYFSARQMAAIAKTSPGAIARRCRAGIVPGAMMVQTPQGSVWKIPDTPEARKACAKRGVGRPKK